MKISNTATAAILVSTSLCKPTPSSWSEWRGPAPTAIIDSGPIIGKTVAATQPGLPTVNQFLGVPFAEPPLNDLRFAPPLTASPWTNARSTTSSPPACLQDFGNASSGRVFQMNVFNNPPPPNGESEDCLYLNVYAPLGGAGNKAVLFWIYGGGYDFGASSLPLYDGTNFAANQDVIIVSANYRTNVFGFPRSPQLPLDSQNLGLLDQRLALDWVQRNIHSFGGDPSKVTISGQSAGAVSVNNLINTMPQNQTFRAAILESGSAVTPIPAIPPNNVTTSWTALMKLINCTQASDAEVLACARSVNASEILTVVQKTGLKFSTYVTDNVTHISDPVAAYAANEVAKVPILAGSNFNDGTAFARNMNNLTEFLTGLALPTTSIAAITKLYGPGSPAAAGLTSEFQIISKLITDSTFLCPASFLANLTTTYVKTPAWVYLFNATFPNTQHPKYPHLGVYHSSEIALWFGNYPEINATPGEKELSAYMQKAWGNFVKDPYAGPGWSQFPSVEALGAGGGRAIEVTDSVAAIEQICTQWDKVYLAAGAA